MHHDKIIHYSCKQLRRLWVNSGGPKDQQDSAAAVAYAESSGYRYATHVNGPGNVDKGLWQINDVYWPGDSHYRPSLNVRAAIKIQGLDGWTAWSSVNGHPARRNSCGEVP